MSASSLAEVKAARGGLDGGDGNPEEPTSGIPLCPCTVVSRQLRVRGEGTRTAGAGSGVMEAGETGRGVYDVRTGEDAGLAAYELAIAITRMVFDCTGSHCSSLATVAMGTIRLVVDGWMG